MTMRKDVYLVFSNLNSETLHKFTIQARNMLRLTNVFRYAWVIYKTIYELMRAFSMVLVTVKRYT